MICNYYVDARMTFSEVIQNVLLLLYITVLLSIYCATCAL